MRENSHLSHTLNLLPLCHSWAFPYPPNFPFTLTKGFSYELEGFFPSNYNFFFFGGGGGGWNWIVYTYSLACSFTFLSLFTLPNLSYQNHNQSIIFGNKYSQHEAVEFEYSSQKCLWIEQLSLACSNSMEIFYGW